MALKDLIADRSRLTEAAIEEIIRDHVRYDPNSYEVVLTPAGLALSNDAKVLVLLVAVAGWQYVVDEVYPVDTKPAALEQMTGIGGGTLRPTLKKLKDAHLLVVTSDGYAVRVTNLDAIGRVIAGCKTIPKPTSHKLKRIAADKEHSIIDGAALPAESRSTKGRLKTGVPIRGSLTRLVEHGFFAEERTLGEVVVRLHEMAIIAKSTSLSGPIAGMVRDGKLVRKKATQNGKDIWRYRAI